MRLARYIPNACDSARERCSREVDDELSTFEQRLLEAHVSRCDECRAFRAGVAGATGLLRAAELERPSAQIRMPGARRFHLGIGRVLAPAAAAAMVAAIAIVMNTGLFGSGKPVRPVAPPSFGPTSISPSNADLLQQRKARIAQLTKVFVPPGPGGPQLPGSLTG